MNCVLTGQSRMFISDGKTLVNRNVFRPNSFNPKISLVILLTIAIRFLWCYFGELGI